MARSEASVRYRIACKTDFNIMKTDENRIEDSMALNIVEIVVRLRITPASGALWAHPLVSQKKKKKER